MSFPFRQMHPTNEINGNIGSTASSSSGISLGQQANMNVNMNNMNMAEDSGHEFHHHLDGSDMKFSEFDEDVFDINLGSENHDGGSGDDDTNQTPGSKKKKYCRHTQLQMQEMENFFKQCQLPDKEQRKKLGRQLGLTPPQVKWWFQNRRNQAKMLHGRNETQHLRGEIQKLKLNNSILQEAIDNASCVACVGQIVFPKTSSEEEALRIKNDGLIEELNRMTGITAKYAGRRFLRYEDGNQMIVPHLLNPPFVNYERMFPMAGEVDLFRKTTRLTEDEKDLMAELVVDGMVELVRMTQTDKTLWTPSIDGTTIPLRYQEYFRMFSGRRFGLQPHRFKFEASRCMTTIKMSCAFIVEMLMNVNQWSAVFSSIVRRAMELEVLATSSSRNYNGALHLIVAEFQLPSPILPTRSNFFARYCKQHPNGIWSVVDVPLEALRPGLVIRLHRRPSGCLIQELSNGYSKVTWVEQIEVDDALIHNLYKPLVNNGLTFGAQRWLGTLDRQCERIASAFIPIPSSNLANMGKVNQEGRQSMTKLSERIVRSFHEGVSSTIAHPWKLLAGTGVDDARIMSMRFANEPGRPNGVALCTSTSFWVPASPKSLFNFLSEVSTRHEWDILCNHPAEQIAHISTGQEAENCISLYRIIGGKDKDDNIIILQETSADAMGFFVIYAPLDIRSMNTVFAGSDSSVVPILPSGVAILPDGNGGNGKIGGSLVTVGLQFLVDSDPTAELSLTSIASAHGLITCTVDRIKSHAVDIYNAFLQPAW